MPIRKRIDALGWRRFQRLSLMAAVLLLATAWLTFSLNQIAGRHFQQSTQALSGVDAARDYLQAALDAETGAGSYVLTGEATYLAPFERGRAQRVRARDELLERIGTSPALQQRVAAMDSALDDALKEMQTAISLYREQGPDVVVDYLRGGFGKDLMGRVRSENAAISMALTESGRHDLAAMEDARKRRDWAAALALLLGLACGLGAFWVIREHTLALQDEHLLRLRAEQAMRESSEKSAFLANMSHEIRTPMNAIFGFTQLLGDLVTGARERHYVNAIRSSGEALLALINDILDLSRVESGRIDLRLLPTHVQELLSVTTTMFAQQLVEKRLRLSARLEGTAQPLMLDTLRVRQVLFNLVSNAIKYTDSGQIAVIAQVQPQGEFAQLALIVRDTGIGIGQADQTRIFEAFTQVDLPDRAARGGTGLGLGIVRRLMEAMGGSISVDSKLGQGSTFTAVWPRVALAPSSAPVSAKLHCQLAELAPLKVLVIDDVALNREVLRAFFAGTHHQFHDVADAASGLTHMRQSRPDVLLLDLRMPGMDGYEALRQIRADSELCAIRVLAATAANLSVEDLQRGGFDGYVRKPITREALSAELMRLFGGSVDPHGPPAELHSMSLTGLDQEARVQARADNQLITARCARARDTLSTQALTELERQIETASAWVVALFAQSVERLRDARERFELVAMEDALEDIAAQSAQLAALLDAAQEPT